MRVERMGDTDAAVPAPDWAAEWDAFVEARPEATLAHAAAWARVVREGYGLEPLYLAARDADGRLAGVLPLVRFRTLAGRRELVSMPFLDTGGVLARDEAAEAALVEAALAEARAWRAGVVELRQATPLRSRGDAPAAARVNLVLALPEDEEALWGALSAKVRNQTRKATREGLRLADGSETAAQVEAFYAPFRVNMRDLGSPVHGVRFYRAIAQAFGSRVRFVVAEHAGRPVGGLVALHAAGRVTVPWASTLRSERSRCPNNLIYWEALRWAVAKRARAFDFGRSPPGSGTHRFKLGWGAREEPLHWLRLDASGAALPAAPAHEGSTLRRASTLWSRMPVALASWLGPPLRRRLSQ